MSSRKYLHLASTRRFKEILSGGFESNKTGMCDLACTIICPVLSFCYYFQMWNSHSSTILQVKLGQEKNNALPQLQGAPIRAVMRLATQASIQNSTCSRWVVEMSPPAPRSPVPAWAKRWWLERWDPHGTGGRLRSALLYEQMGCLGQKSAAFGCNVLGCSGLQTVPSPPLPGRESSGMEAVPSLRARIGASVLA